MTLAKHSRFRAILGLGRDARTMYVAVSLGVNLLLLVRSYLFILVLDYRELGLVALLQSTVLLLSILQFGVLNGGYRLSISGDPAERQGIDDFVYSFIAALSGVALVVALAAWPFVARTEDGLMGLLGVVGGAATLVRTWQSNRMIADGELAVLNTINLGSTLASLALLLFIPVDPLYASMATIVAQPLLFVAVAWRLKAGSRPERFVLDRYVARRIMAAGFTIFLAGILLQVNVQLERWYVTAALGITALGHLFLAIMFVSLLQLVPAALDAVFLPSAVRAHGAGDARALTRTIRTYLLFLLAYAAVAALAVWLCAEPLLTLLAPKYVPDLRYVYLITPGALLLTLSSAFALTFTVLIRYRFLLTAYAIGTLALSAVFASAVVAGVRLSLSEITAARSAAMGLTALLVAAGWWLIARREPIVDFVRRPEPRN